MDIEFNLQILANNYDSGKRSQCKHIFMQWLPMLCCRAAPALHLCLLQPRRCCVLTCPAW